jgi:hypothetical protein
MNEPTAIAIPRAMESRIIEFGMGPFVSLLSYLKIPDTTGERLVEAYDFASFVVCDAFFHHFNRSFGDDPMLRPILVTLTFFVLFPVFAFSLVAAHARPSRMFAAVTPRTNCVPGDEGARGWLGVSVGSFVDFDECVCSFTI